jgi:hypothetical protein
MGDRDILAKRMPQWKSVKAEIEAEAPPHCRSAPIITKGGITFYRCAGIATTLQEQKDLKSPNDVVKIVGLDGTNVVTGSGYPWHNILEKWLNRTISVHYFFWMPNSPTKRLLKTTALKHSNLRVFVANHQAKVTEFQRIFRTFHFVLISEPRQMWIEEQHGPGRTFAENCYFFNTEATHRYDDLWRSLDSSFDQLIAQTGVALPTIPTYILDWDFLTESESDPIGELVNILKRASADKEEAIIIRHLPEESAFIQKSLGLVRLKNDELILASFPEVTIRLEEKHLNRKPGYNKHLTSQEREKLKEYFANAS